MNFLKEKGLIMSINPFFPGYKTGIIDCEQHLKLVLHENWEPLPL